MKTDSDQDPEHDTEAFLRLLASHERWLATYVYSLVSNASDAEEILQDCKLVMWRHFGNFAPGSNFKAWARRIALHHVLNYRRAQKRRPLTALDEGFLEAVAAEMDRRGDELDRRSEALRTCLRKLPPAHRVVIVRRYYDDREIDEIAAETKRSPGAVYRLLSRIREALNDCVTRELARSPA